LKSRRLFSALPGSIPDAVIRQWLQANARNTRVLPAGKDSGILYLRTEKMVRAAGAETAVFLKAHCKPR
jgi:hypothetical protein